MAVKDIVTRGFGPSEVKFVPTRGYESGAAAPAAVAPQLALVGVGR